MAGEISNVHETMMMGNDAAVKTEGTALFVDDLDLTVSEEDLKRLFGQKGELSSVKLCVDETQQLFGYAYVNYIKPEDAKSALDDLNFTCVNGKPIRICYSFEDSSYVKNPAANIFVKNLDKSIDNQEFHRMFKIYGNIASSKVERNSATGESKGFGYVQFETEESARKAIEDFNGAIIREKEVYVGLFVSKEERGRNADNNKFTNVFVKNISEHICEKNLSDIFSKYGPLNSVAVMRSEGGISKCFGFVDFENAEDARMAVEKLNGKLFDGKQWYVGKAQKKAEREKELHTVRERIENSDMHGFNNLYIKNLDYSVDDEKLKEMFASFGTITSSKIMRDAKGLSKGVGLVAFSKGQEASNAILQMNGKMFGRKPLYVAIAEKKEARKARFQAIFSNMPISFPHWSMYRSPSPRPAAIPNLPHLPGFGYQPLFATRPVYPNMLFPTARPQSGLPNVPVQFPFPMMMPQSPLPPPMMPQQGTSFGLPLGTVTQNRAN